MKHFLSILITLCSLILLNSCLDDDKDTSKDNESSLYWAGVHATPPLNPAENWAYFNYIDKISYIYSENGWDTMAVSGIDGISIQWQGSLETPPDPAYLNWTYYNTVDSCSYIFNGASWSVITMNGKDGLSIEWQGELDEAPQNPKVNWMYRNLTNGHVYIFNGAEWETVTMDGLDGTALLWQGTSEIPPSNPEEGWAYYNSADKKSYIFANESWQILCRDGVDGANGASIQWMGALDKEPEEPQELWAYYNTVSGNSYIFNGKVWEILAQSGQDGKDGISIVWLGEYYNHPYKPEINNAYYSIKDKVSYIWTGKEWDTLAVSGSNGVDGEDGASIQWLGSKSSHPYYPSKNDAYYNYIEGITYIYNGNYWDIMCKDGDDGNSADTTKYLISGYVSHGDSLVLQHNLGTNSLYFLGQFVGSDSLVHSWEYVDPSWPKTYTSTSEKHFFTMDWSSSEKQFHQKKKIDDDKYIITYNNYDKAVYTVVSGDGSELLHSQFDSLSAWESYPFMLNNGNTLTIAYVDENLTPKLYVAGALSSTITKVSEDSITSLSVSDETDSTLLFLYTKKNGTIYYKRASITGTLSKEMELGEGVANNVFPSRVDGGVLLVWEKTGKKVDTHLIDSSLALVPGYTIINYHLQAPVSMEIRKVIPISGNRAIALYRVSAKGTGTVFYAGIINADGSNPITSQTLHPTSFENVCSITETADNRLAFVLDNNLVITDESLNILEKGSISTTFKFEYPEIYYNSDETFSLLFSTGDEIYSQKLEKFDAQIKLKRLSKDKAALCNFSGQKLWMTLSIHQGRKRHPDAVMLP